MHGGRATARRWELGAAGNYRRVPQGTCACDASRFKIRGSCVAAKLHMHACGRAAPELDGLKEVGDPAARRDRKRAHRDLFAAKNRRELRDAGRIEAAPALHATAAVSRPTATSLHQSACIYERTALCPRIFPCRVAASGMRGAGGRAVIRVTGYAHMHVAGTLEWYPARLRCEFIPRRHLVRRVDTCGVLMYQDAQVQDARPTLATVLVGRFCRSLG